ncbi:uncharacterized protein LOC132290601 isoform X2 [Cornus florida]|uniref:uncharacterized protein LOC132290601 isoform X2 n=1 Tax=Cornus florida TaxID=4283 RepID=UPI0028971942|nr:uncharacterized protein LOC132290601 isoform X2 [Cornus florida]
MPTRRIGAQLTSTMQYARREINKKLGTTQFRVPETNKLKEVFKKLHQIEAAPLRKEEFQEILKDVILETESEEKKAKEIGRTIDLCYQTHFAANANKKDWSSAEFYYAICQTVEEINKKLGTKQYRAPETNKLNEVFKKRIAALLRKEILEDVIHESRLGVKDLWPYIFGVPVTTLWIKNWVFPKALPNEFFIPFVTSATVFLLAKLNKI